MFDKTFGPFRSGLHLCIHALLAFLFVLFVDALTQPFGLVGDDAPQDYSMFLPFIPPNIPDGARPVAESITAISVKLEDDVGHGTGFVVRDGVVATAAHVVEHEGDATFTVFCNDREVEAEVLITMPERDVALLSADCTGPQLAFFLGELDVDVALIITGFDFEMELSNGAFVTMVTQYYVQSSPIPTAELTTAKIPDDKDMGAKKIIMRMEKADSPKLIGITGAIDPGNSGSPVFTRSGVIVGMAIIFDQEHNRTFIVPAESIFFAMLMADAF